LNDRIKKWLARVASVGGRNELNRIEWVQAALRNVPAGSRLLDAGAGEQLFKSSCAHLSYVSQDIALYDGKGNERGLQTGAWDTSSTDIVSDIASIPEPAASFDAVLCTEVLEHLAEPLAAIKEFSRLLRPGGELILTAPFCSLTHFAPYHFSTGFSRYYFEFHLPRYGFKITEITPNGNFFEYLGQEIRRVPWVTKRYATSRLGMFDWLAIYGMLRRLRRLSRTDSGSHEMLSYGMHVRATRGPDV
jgi:ubiquinone/menaquinone biosynthesis C-methylase UbiE